MTGSTGCYGFTTTTGYCQLTVYIWIHNLSVWIHSRILWYLHVFVTSVRWASTNTFTTDSSKTDPKLLTVIMFGFNHKQQSITSPLSLHLEYWQLVLPLSFEELLHCCQLADYERKYVVAVRVPFPFLNPSIKESHHVYSGTCHGPLTFPCIRCRGSPDQASDSWNGEENGSLCFQLLRPEETSWAW